jgi:phospholipase D1/2
MRTGRIRFMRMLQDVGVAHRFHLVYPEVSDSDRTVDTMIHSKVFIVDDRFLRVGSANLNNRSMGTDTECDLAFEATTEQHRRAIQRLRNRLLGEHCGATADDVAAAMQTLNSIIQTAQTLTKNGHALRPVDDGEPDAEQFSALDEVADPARPLANDIVEYPKLGARFSRPQVSTLAKVGLAALLVIALPLAWHYTPLAALASPEAVGRTLLRMANSEWAGPLVIGLFVLAGLVAFPVTLLIAMTAATFGPIAGFA